MIKFNFLFGSFALISNSSTVLYEKKWQQVDRFLTNIFPEESLNARNSLSRKDGYWKYISKGEEPPMELTYGEFDIEFFSQILEKAGQYHNSYNYQHKGLSPPMQDKVFVDLGSGSGKLVLAAASLYPDLKLSKGIELLQGLHDHAICIQNEHIVGTDELALFQSNGSIEYIQEATNICPLQFIHGSFTDPNIYLGDSDVIFVFSTCMEHCVANDLGAAIGRQCKEGTIIITIDYALPLSGIIDPVDGDMGYGKFEFELIESMDGECKLTKDSTAHFHRIIKSHCRY